MFKRSSFARPLEHIYISLRPYVIDNKCIDYPENKVKEPRVKTNIQPFAKE